jgi:hypothetical protein
MATLLEYKDAGADEIAIYGNTSAQNENLIAAWWARRSAMAGTMATSGMAVR